jgi:hypothetical protein
MSKIKLSIDCVIALDCYFIGISKSEKSVYYPSRPQLLFSTIRAEAYRLSFEQEKNMYQFTDLRARRVVRDF